MSGADHITVAAGPTASGPGTSPFSGPVATTPNRARHFLRCPDCLGAWAVDVEVTRATVPGPWARRGRELHALNPAIAAGCPYDCGSDLQPEDLGHVTVTGRLERLDGGEAECDSSYTHARGPNCECQCGGMNHGAGVLADIPITSDQDTPRARFLAAPKSAGLAKARAVEWRSTLVAVGAAIAPRILRLGELRDRKHRHEWISGDDYNEMIDLAHVRAAFDSLPKLRTHAGRMAAAQKLLGGAR